jgi:hypothetical protein
VACHRAAEVWAFFHRTPMPLDCSAADTLLHNTLYFEETTIPSAMAWNIWKPRNAMVFDSRDDPLVATVKKCIDDLRLWAHRCSRTASSDCILSWCT